MGTEHQGFALHDSTARPSLGQKKKGTHILGWEVREPSRGAKGLFLVAWSPWVKAFEKVSKNEAGARPLVPPMPLSRYQSQLPVVLLFKLPQGWKKAEALGRKLRAYKSLSNILTLVHPTQAIPASFPPACQACSYLRAFARAVLSARHLPSSPLYTVGAFSSFKSQIKRPLPDPVLSGTLLTSAHITVSHLCFFVALPIVSDTHGLFPVCLLLQTLHTRRAGTGSVLSTV